MLGGKSRCLRYSDIKNFTFRLCEEPQSYESWLSLEYSMLKQRVKRRTLNRPLPFKGDAILVGNNDGHGSEGYNPSLGLYTGQVCLNPVVQSVSW